VKGWRGSSFGQTQTVCGRDTLRSQAPAAAPFRPVDQWTHLPRIGNSYLLLARLEGPIAPRRFRQALESIHAGLDGNRPNSSFHYLEHSAEGEVLMGTMR
jgi:hypothetical protein